MEPIQVNISFNSVNLTFFGVLPDEVIVKMGLRSIGGQEYRISLELSLYHLDIGCICAINDWLASIFFLLYSDENKQEWKAKDKAGCRGF